MTVIHLDQFKNKNRFETFASLASGATSNWIILNDLHNRNALCSVHPGASGTMRMEYTLDSLSTVESGSPKEVIWDAGDVNTDTGRQVPTNVTAIRFVATTDSGDYRVVA